MENKVNKSQLCHNGGVYHCQYNNSIIGTVIYISKEDNDTIIGYECDYTKCSSIMCQLKEDYPIGTSDNEAKRKLSSKHR